LVNVGGVPFSDERRISEQVSNLTLVVVVAIICSMGARDIFISTNQIQSAKLHLAGSPLLNSGGSVNKSRPKSGLICACYAGKSHASYVSISLMNSRLLNIKDENALMFLPLGVASYNKFADKSPC
jgi:hypothetical protein